MRLGLDGDREGPRVPDSARDPSGTRDGLWRLGRREGGLQLPVAARTLRVFPGTNVPVPQRQCTHLRGGLQLARLRGPRPRRAGASTPSPCVFPVGAKGAALVRWRVAAASGRH